MKNPPDALIKSSQPDDYIYLGQQLSERMGLDLTGKHEAEKVTVHTRKSTGGEFDQNVGVRINLESLRPYRLVGLSKDVDVLSVGRPASSRGYEGESGAENEQQGRVTQRHAV